MAEHTFTKADLDYIYQTLISGGAKMKDIPRILKSLPESFTLADLKSKANLKGLSSTSMDLWNQALSTMDSAVNAAPPPTATVNTTPTTGNTGPQGNVKQTDIVDQYMAPTGPSTSALSNLFLGNTPMQQTGLPPWMQGPFQAAPSPTESYLQNRLMNLRPTPPSGLENLIGRMAGQGPQGLTPPASSAELNLGLLGQNPYLAQIAAGKIPQSMMDALNAQMNLSRANTMEATNMGGALTSSDLAEGLSRAESDARTNFLASMADKANAATGTLGNLLGAGGGLYNQRTGLGSSLFSNLLGTGVSAQQGRQQLDLNTLLGLGNPLLSTQAGSRENALGRYLGLGTGLAGAEAGRGEAGTGRAFTDYLRNSGLPPEMQALLALMGMGGSQTSTGTATGTPGLGGDLLGALGQLGSAFMLMP
jgi:hypothetical protein